MGGKRSASNKKKRQNILVRIFNVHAWKLILIAILLAFVTATLLRIDHIKMANLRDEVMAADETGDEEELIKKINELREFVATHIVFNIIDDNGAQKVIFGTGPFYLENTYKRKAEAAIQKAQELANEQPSVTNPNGNIYSKVADVCDTLASRYGWGWNHPSYLSCWTDELAKYPSSGSIDVFGEASVPDASLYRKDYSSPIWYPCLSGIAMVVCAILLLWAAIRIIVFIIVRLAMFFIEKIG